MQRLTRREVLVVSAFAALACTASAVGIGGVIFLLRRAAPAQVPTETPALPPQPLIVPRSAWGARGPDHLAPNEYGYAATPLDGSWWVYPGDLRDVYTTVVIHHTAHAHETVETMQDIQDLHMNRNGWADIGYHFGIDTAGNIYEGRDIGVRGASVGGFNTGLIGVVLMGNFEVDHPTEAQITSVQRLVHWLTARFSLSHLAGHSDFNDNTVCPGEHLSLRLDELATAAGLDRGAAGYVPPTS